MVTNNNYYFQKCNYKKKQGDAWEQGIACVDGLGCSDVKYILNKNGNKVVNIYDYDLYPPSFNESVSITLKDN